MTTLRDDLLPVFNDARTLIDGLGLRQNTVTIRTRTWTGAPGLLTSSTSDSDLLLTPSPKVRRLNGHEISQSGGRFRLSDLKAGPITPLGTGFGYTPDQLRPIGSASVEIFYLVSGSEGGEYALEELQTDRNFGYFLILRRRETTP